MFALAPGSDDRLDMRRFLLRCTPLTPEPAMFTLSVILAWGCPRRPEFIRTGWRFSNGICSARAAGEAVAHRHARDHLSGSTPPTSLPSEMVSPTHVEGQSASLNIDPQPPRGVSRSLRELVVSRLSLGQERRRRCGQECHRNHSAVMAAIGEPLDPALLQLLARGQCDGPAPRHRTRGQALEPLRRRRCNARRICQ